MYQSLKYATLHIVKHRLNYLELLSLSFFSLLIDRLKRSIYRKVKRMKSIIEVNETPSKTALEIFFISIILTILVTSSYFFSGKIIEARSFLVGTITSLIYLRLQVLFINNFYKKDFLSKLISMLAAGRIILIAAILFVVFKRTDLFNFLPTILGLVSVHIISLLTFISKAFLNKKNLMIN